MVKLVLMLIQVFITLKPKNQYFKGCLMLVTSLNSLEVLIIPGISLKLFVGLKLVLMTIV